MWRRSCLFKRSRSADKLLSVVLREGERVRERERARERESETETETERERKREREKERERERERQRERSFIDNHEVTEGRSVGKTPCRVTPPPGAERESTFFHDSQHQFCPSLLPRPPLFPPPAPTTPTHKRNNLSCQRTTLQGCLMSIGTNWYPDSHRSEHLFQGNHPHSNGSP